MELFECVEYILDHSLLLSPPLLMFAGSDITKPTKKGMTCMTSVAKPEYVPRWQERSKEDVTQRCHPSSCNTLRLKMDPAPSKGRTIPM